MLKKRTILFMVIVIILTNAITLTAGNLIGLKFGNRVIISGQEYRYLTEMNNQYAKAVEIKSIIDNNYLREVDDQKLLDGQLKGMVASLEDPYSVYMTEEEFTRSMEDISGVYSGIGVIVTPGEDNLITVVSPIEDTPGERAGIKTGDKIVMVNGVEYFGDTMDEAVKVMKGKPNTDVKLTIVRADKEGKNETLELSITREEIRLETVKSDVIENNIGYIKITSFDEITYEDFKTQLNQLVTSKAEGLIIDLRNNPGGLLNICADIADELLGKGTIVYTETKAGEREYLNSDKGMVNLPMVVLVNEGSASASEIMAGAIKDHNRGEIIGTTTFGKGVVQRIKPLKDGSGLKLTVSEYFTPNGINIHGIGIEPDIVVELNENVERIGPDNLSEDNQLQKAIEVLNKKMGNS